MLSENGYTTDYCGAHSVTGTCKKGAAWAHIQVSGADALVILLAWLVFEV